MKIINTNARPAAVTDNLAAVRAIVEAAPDRAEWTADDVRAALPAGKRGAVTDAVLHQIAIDLGWKVEL